MATRDRQTPEPGPPGMQLQLETHSGHGAPDSGNPVLL